MRNTLSCCIYVSHAEVDARSAKAAAIYLDARRNNAARGLTGYLHREGNTFAQYIEGPEAAIDDLLAKLRRDWRHRGMVVRLDRQIEARRLFEGWDMAFTDEDMRPYRAWAEANSRRRDLRHARAGDLLDFFREAVPRGEDATPDAPDLSACRLAHVAAAPAPAAIRCRR